MIKIQLSDFPAQRFTFRFNGDEFKTYWQFNTINGYWSLTVWLNDEKTPSIASKRVLPNFDLFYGADMGADIAMIVKTYKDDRSTNWYDRFAKSPKGALITVMTRGEYAAL
jgi:hypothetical protein